MRPDSHDDRTESALPSHGEVRSHHDSGLAELAERIRARGHVLVQRSVAAMYENPFWDERFGERGRRYAEEDGHHHVSYLVAALRLESPGVMTRYARWLQSILTTRGMCSRHIADNFARLGEAIRAEGIPDAEPALAYLNRAAEALLYDPGPARALQEAAEIVAGDVVATLRDRHPRWYAGWNDAGEARCIDDLRYHLSYLADAVALEQPRQFADYVSWVAGFLEHHNVPRLHLREMLAVLDERLGHLPPEAGAAARHVLAAGRAAGGTEGAFS